MQPTLRERCLAVELLVLDVDGVLTEGGIAYGCRGDDASYENKVFHVRDGSALKAWHDAGKRSAVITGRRSPVVARRAEELGISWVYQGTSDKLGGLHQLQAETGHAVESICYVGDDDPDVPALKTVGLAVAVADACVEARRVAHYVTTATGGRGAVRETIERILRCQGKWR